MPPPQTFAQEFVYATAKCLSVKRGPGFDVIVEIEKNTAGGSFGRGRMDHSLGVIWLTDQRPHGLPRRPMLGHRTHWRKVAPNQPARDTDPQISRLFQIRIGAVFSTSRTI